MLETYKNMPIEFEKAIALLTAEIAELKNSRSKSDDEVTNNTILGLLYAIEVLAEYQVFEKVEKPV